MSPRTPSATIETLLEHASWLRRLARSLVGDAQRAEDLSQETWVRALQHPPAVDRPVRGWLATVMRNVLLQERRGASRRSARELRVALDRPETTEDDGLDLLGKVTLHRELVAAVLELEEPYRQTILLRYFEEYSPKKIAAEKGIPVATVKTRLQRGLQRLRARLDEAHGGDGRSWALALLPLARRPAGLGPALPWTDISLGAAALNTKIVVAVVGLSALGAAFFMLSRGPETPRPEEVARAAPLQSLALPEQEPGRAPEPRLDDAAGVPQREEVAGPSLGFDSAPGVPGERLQVRGRVIDVEGRPVAGVEIRTTGDSAAMAREAARPGPVALGVTAGDGSFEIELALENRAELIVHDDYYTTFLTGRPVARSSGKETVLVVAARIVIAGQVVDSAGLPVDEARVQLKPPADLRARLGLVLDYSNELEYRLATNAGGDFDLGDAPALPGATLAVTRAGFLTHEEPAPLVSSPDLLISLQRPEPTREILSGIVVDASGFPVEDALVSLGMDTRTTDGRGLFEFMLGDPRSFNSKLSGWLEVDDGKLIALRPGYQPAELLAERDSEGQPRWPGHVVLQLGTEPLSIAGTVVDVNGEPLAELRVWVADPTLFGGIGDPNADRFPRITHVETELAGGERGWHFVETDAEGRFLIEGVLDRSYTLQAMDPTTLLRIEKTDVRGGQRNVELVMPANAVYAVLRGKVVDRHGNAVPNVSVAPMCDSFRLRVQDQILGTRHTRANAVTTDAAGRFELENVPRDLVYLRLDGVDTVPLEWGRHEEGGLYSLVGERFENLEIEVGRRCHFQVELMRADEADQIGVLDAEGSVLEISEFLGTSRREGKLFALNEGRSNPLGVSDRAAWLVLYREGEEVRRLGLQLVAGEQTTVRP